MAHKMCVRGGDAQKTESSGFGKRKSRGHGGASLWGGDGLGMIKRQFPLSIGRGSQWEGKWAFAKGRRGETKQIKGSGEALKFLLERRIRSKN